MKRRIFNICLDSETKELVLTVEEHTIVGLSAKIEPQKSINQGPYHCTGGGKFIRERKSDCVYTLALSHSALQ